MPDDLSPLEIERSQILEQFLGLRDLRLDHRRCAALWKAILSLRQTSRFRP
jgi:hypothetical protein